MLELDSPLLETQDEWVLHGFSFANYLGELGPKAQSEIYEKSSIDLALKDAHRKMRAFLMKRFHNPSPSSGRVAERSEAGWGRHGAAERPHPAPAAPPSPKTGRERMRTSPITQ